MRRDSGQFLYTSLQGQWAKKNLPNELVQSLSAVVVIEKGRIYIGAEAVLLIGRRLSWPWSLLARAMAILPAWFLNWGYSFVARHRYRIFGERDTCRLPTLAEREKFLD